MITSAVVTDTATKVSLGRTRRWCHLANRSAVTIYVKYDGSETALTVANGIPIAAGAIVMLGNSGRDQDFFHDIWAIHASAGENKSLVIHEG